MNPDENPNHNFQDDAHNGYSVDGKPIPGMDFQQSPAVNQAPTGRKEMFIGIAVVLTAFLVLVIIVLNFGSISNGTFLNNGTAENTDAVENQPVTYDPDKHPRDLPLSVADNQRYWDMTNMGMTNIAFSIYHDHRHWADAKEANTDLYDGIGGELQTDPSTGQPYIITDTLPKRGEMQYKLGYLCAKNLRSTGEKADTDNIYLFLVMMDDGSYLCKSNVQ